jgi:hypothetical protein
MATVLMVVCNIPRAECHGCNAIAALSTVDEPLLPVSNCVQHNVVPSSVHHSARVHEGSIACSVLRQQ